MLQQAPLSCPMAFNPIKKAQLHGWCPTDQYWQMSSCLFSLVSSRPPMPDFILEWVHFFRQRLAALHRTSFQNLLVLCWFETPVAGSIRGDGARSLFSRLGFPAIVPLSSAIQRLVVSPFPSRFVCCQEWAWPASFSSMAVRVADFFGITCVNGSFLSLVITFIHAVPS